ncbi:hypothetical protein FQN50_002250 [Emmonsiellopsis sp. PD_5]|nr:hypothetical protein FQN50_002250 [Emmonsiellopsis sp. PD_5]
MSYTAETLEARKDCYLALLAIRRKVCDPEADHIDKQTMKVAGIEQFFMDISQDSDCKPLFFTPYQHKYDGLDKSAYSYPTYRPASDNYFNVGGLHVYMQNCMSQSLETQPSGVRYQSYATPNSTYVMLWWAILTTS